MEKNISKSAIKNVATKSARKRTADASASSSASTSSKEDDKGQPETKRRKKSSNGTAATAETSAQCSTNGHTKPCTKVVAKSSDCERMPTEEPSPKELLQIVLTRSDLTKLEAECSDFEHFRHTVQDCLARVRLHDVEMISHITNMHKEMRIQNVQFGKRLWLQHLGLFEFDQILKTLPNADEMAAFLAKDEDQFQIRVPTKAIVAEKWQQLVQLLGEEWERKRLNDDPDSDQSANSSLNSSNGLEHARCFSEHSEAFTYIEGWLGPGIPLEDEDEEILEQSAKRQNEEDDAVSTYSAQTSSDQEDELDGNGQGGIQKEGYANAGEYSFNENEEEELDYDEDESFNDAPNGSLFVTDEANETILEEDDNPASNEEIQSAEQLSQIVLTFGMLDQLRSMGVANSAKVAVGCLLLCEIAGTNKPHIDEIKALTSEDVKLKHCSFQYEDLTEYKPGFTDQVLKQWEKDRKDWDEEKPQIAALKEKVRIFRAVLADAERNFQLRMDLDRLAASPEGEAFKIFVNQSKLKQLLILGHKRFKEVVEGLLVQFYVDNDESFHNKELVVGPVSTADFNPNGLVQISIAHIGSASDPLYLHHQSAPNPARMRECLKRFQGLGYLLPSSEQIAFKHAQLQKALEDAQNARQHHRIYKKPKKTQPPADMQMPQPAVVHLQTAAAAAGNFQNPIFVMPLNCMPHSAVVFPVNAQQPAAHNQNLPAHWRQHSREKRIHSQSYPTRNRVYQSDRPKKEAQDHPKVKNRAHNGTTNVDQKNMASNGANAFGQNEHKRAARRSRFGQQNESV